ncbi:MAG: Type 1 glutamine amidotransferase-like domain-containing protein, partial [Oscillospiraceae bacterium]|nr:Type 1 glutamine amidotransferase-like domain-containing protein [Oscillospiraceae bacterium]
MICFLTSVTSNDGRRLNTQNGFADELRKAVPQPCEFLFVCSDPDVPEKTDFFAAEVRDSFTDAGFAFTGFTVLDRRNAQSASKLVKKAGLIVLGGGHVPTQNRFFTEIGLRELLSGHNGVVVGISAGSMNAAETVYAQPELPGEAKDPDYRRFLKGLGLTRTMLLPHYQEYRNDILDGMRVYEDITYPDSRGRRFYAICDGSWLLVRDGAEELRGEAYL